MIRVPKEQFDTRVNHHSPTAAYYKGIISDVYNVLDQSIAARAVITTDKMLSEIGKREKLTALVNDQVRRLCEAGKSYRMAASQIYGERVNLGKPKFDPADIASASERVEVRNAIRSERDPANKWKLAETFFAQDRRYAEALLSGPGTGLDGARMTQLHERYLETYFNGDLAQLKTREEDLGPVKGAIEAAHMMLKDGSGLNDNQYAQLATVHQNEIDGVSR